MADADAAVMPVEAQDVESQAPASAERTGVLSEAAGYPVYVLGTTTCPFTIEAKAHLLEALEGDQAAYPRVVHILDVDKADNGAQTRKEAALATGQKTVPFVFIDGEFIGGCNELKAIKMPELKHRIHLAMKKHGLSPENAPDDATVKAAALKADKLARELAEEPDDSSLSDEQHTRHHAKNRGRSVPAVYDPSLFRRAPKKEHAPLQHGVTAPLFLFNDTVDGNVVRVVGVLVVICCVLLIVFREDTWAHYATAALLIDYCIRFARGADASPLGMIAMVVCARMTPKFAPGPPKQFAALCGITFSLLATVFYFTGIGDYIPGAVVLGMLAGAAGLEGFADFCFGCFMFGYLVQFGLVDPDVYRIHLDTKEESVEAWKQEMPALKRDGVKAALALPEQHLVPPAPDVKPLVTDLKYKAPKPDEWTRSDFDVIKHTSVDYFYGPLGIVGLALMWSVMASMIETPNTVWYACGIGAGVYFVILVIFYAVRCFMYPHKVKKDWDHPERSNAFGAITICFMAFAFLLNQIPSSSSSTRDALKTAAEVIFWVGAGPHYAMFALKMAEWVGLRSFYDDETISASWMIFPVGLFVAALVAPTLTASYGGISYFFYAPAFLMWVALFVSSFRKSVTAHASDKRSRMSLWIWVAAPAVAAIATVNMQLVNTTGGSATSTYDSFLFSNLFFIAVGLAIPLGLLFVYPWSYFTIDAPRFDNSAWALVFSLDVLAIAAIMFYSLEQTTDLMHGIYILLVSAANVAAFVILLQTITGILRGRRFRPEDKWGPLSMMKLTHEALRETILPELKRAAENVTPNDVASVVALMEQWRCVNVIHDEHSKAEDKVIFKEFNDWFPAVAQRWNMDHDDDHKVIAEMRSKILRLMDMTKRGDSSGDDAVQLAESIRRDIPAFIDHMNEHLRGEEDHLNPVGRKHIPLALQKLLVERVWDMTPADRWAEYIPWIVNGLPLHGQRVRFTKCFTWAMPYRAQQIGNMLYRKVDDVMWERLVAECPELVPRGAPGWRRFW
ncbi:S-type anion channel SLAH3 [Porphyridium purpureum]|uniref:S-type anion channel SLAH3 n=1 Tax=Porphyridium purpureum TaxID=35688 RepID=A0A5J4Z806_PORPP|nr:S-type anion channel SLAH3 [Porphyridium purpureum]|eukprot:POR7461..scf295_1